MNCSVNKHIGLTRVDILHQRDEAEVTEIIATMTSDSSYVNRSSLTLTEGSMANDSANLSILFNHPLACQDKGRYSCLATGDLVISETFRLVPLSRSSLLYCLFSVLNVVFCSETSPGHMAPTARIKLEPLSKTLFGDEGKPNKPTLLLSRDIVEKRENRADLPHTCDVDVGYPPGKLILESNFTTFESNFTTYFYPNISKVYTTISEETCQAYQTITFYNAFSRRWNGKTLRCSAVNEISLEENEIPPFDLKVVEVLPVVLICSKALETEKGEFDSIHANFSFEFVADYCTDRPRRYYYHPYNCHNFINCTNRKVRVEVCPERTCFGVNETSGCNVCKESECVPNVVANVCVMSNVDDLVPYPHIRCSMYVNCTDRMVHECQENECFDVQNKTCSSRTPTAPSTPERNITCSVSETAIGLNATIVCKIGDIDLTSVSVIFISYSKKEVLMFEVTDVDGPGVLQRNNESSLILSEEGSNQTLSIDLHPLQCELHGLYSVTVNENLLGSINITDSAEAPLIDMANNTNENWILEIRCRGNVGAPAKVIFLEIQYDETTNFHMVPAHNTTIATNKDCNNERETNFTLTMTSNFNNSLVRCSVRNEDHSLMSSEQRRINIITSSVTMERSKSVVYVGDEDFSMKCIVLEHKNLSRVELYHQYTKLGTRDIIVILTQHIGPWTNRSGIVVSDSVISTEEAFLQINFTNATCADEGVYQCVAIGKFTFMSSLGLNISGK
ncbi:hypothetical protein CHS0354_041822 [Potamilus streckersoni]|uniref:Chitin-binding type-2 domain-containing protein n=1 Tax=Potamilus streckersoni TaxID=2493646 RepID=A0AAE0W4M3_9BIVA|nr:hypothetical protein CHS0354_041822 [Potamilus streckersoni]